LITFANLRCFLLELRFYFLELVSGDLRVIFVAAGELLH